MIPVKFLPSFESSKLPHEIAVMTDWFCDELFDSGRNRIVFPISRLIGDVERFREDKDEIIAQIGMGVAYTSASDLSSLRTVTNGEKQIILSRYYDVHHEAFANIVMQMPDTFGHCSIIDCHSFYPSPLPYETDQSADRPDFCIGVSEYHTPEIVVDNLVRFLSEQGYSVKVNSPFAGTFVPMKYYEKDHRVHSVMIEANRKLYMDVPGVKNNQFSTIRSVLKECINTIEKSIYSTMLGATFGAVLAIILAMRFANINNRITSTQLVLSGFAISAVFSSATNYFVYYSNTSTDKARSAMYWMLGSLSGATWEKLTLVLITFAICAVLIFLVHRVLDILLLGDDAATTMGVNLKKVKIIVVALSTVLTGIIVSVSGVIGFVGLVIPHISRSIVGSSHKRLIPAAILIGGFFMIICDVLSRVIVAPQELSIGVVTSFFGAPFFLFLIRKSRHKFGGKS